MLLYRWSLKTYDSACITKVVMTSGGVTLSMDGGGSPVTGDLKVLATKVTAELLHDKN